VAFVLASLMENLANKKVKPTSSINFKDQFTLDQAKIEAKKQNRSLSGYVRNLIENETRKAGK
jgi:hypothetical protein